MTSLTTPAGVTIHAGVILSVAGGRARYQLESGAIGGPARYLQPPPAVSAGDPAHTHTPAAPAAQTPCLVIMLGGQRSSAWVIPFPEEA